MSRNRDSVYARRIPGVVGAGATAPRGQAVWRDFQLSLQRLAGRRLATPCAARPEWTSDEPSDVAIAVAGCSGCPIYRACRSAGLAYSEPGVWGGLYRPSKEEQHA